MKEMVSTTPLARGPWEGEGYQAYIDREGYRSLSSPTAGEPHRPFSGDSDKSALADVECGGP
jgi:hypothetical protein